MSYRSILGVALASSAFATTAIAGELPPIKTTADNAVPACATPGRMMAFLKSRNSHLDPRFEKIAVSYMRQGEELGVRWDYAIAQMAIETNYLQFKAAGGRRSDVAASQNNFAGLGATGRGAHGESFKDVETGVRAHLQHLLLYAGDKVENAVAERTRKVAEWGVLDSFHARIKGPVTFKHLANKWAVSSEYGVAIQTHADKFYADFCKGADPHPEQVAEARAHKATQVAAAEEKPEPKKKGAELARKAIEDGKADGDDVKRGLGAAKIAKPAESEAAAATEEAAPKRTSAPAMTVLNAARPEAEAKPEQPEVAEAAETIEKAERPQKSEKTAKGRSKSDKRTAEKTEKPAAFVTASAGGLAAKSLQAAPAGTKCRVWTASYGGQKAVIIRAKVDDAVNYTVLDVNDGSERREAEAYIAAYAKGGEVAAEFNNQTQALDKAFELCPEG